MCGIEIDWRSFPGSRIVGTIIIASGKLRAKNDKMRQNDFKNWRKLRCFLYIFHIYSLKIFVVDWGHGPSSPQQQHQEQRSYPFGTRVGTRSRVPKIDVHKMRRSKTTYSVSQKNPPWGLVAIFLKPLGIFQPNFTSLLCVPTYARPRIFIQLSATMTKLCHIKRDHPVHIMCAKCPPSAKTHFLTFFQNS